MIQEIGPALFDEVFQADRATPESFGSDIFRESLREGFGRIEFARVAGDVGGDERLVLCRQGTKAIPVQPGLGNVMDVTEIPAPKGGNCQQLRDERFVRVAGRDQRVELHAPHVASGPGLGPAPIDRSTAPRRPACSTSLAAKVWTREDGIEALAKLIFGQRADLRRTPFLVPLCE